MISVLTTYWSLFKHDFHKMVAESIQWGQFPQGVMETLTNLRSVTILNVAYIIFYGENVSQTPTKWKAKTSISNLQPLFVT